MTVLSNRNHRILQSTLKTTGLAIVFLFVGMSTARNDNENVEIVKHSINGGCSCDSSSVRWNHHCKWVLDSKYFQMCSVKTRSYL